MSRAKTVAGKGDWLRAESSKKPRKNLKSRCLSPFLADDHQHGWSTAKVGPAPKQHLNPLRGPVTGRNLRIQVVSLK